MSSAGVWTYTLNNNNAAVEALNVDDSLSDSFTATTADGTQQQVSITIHGFNDLAGLITTRELPIYSEGGAPIALQQLTLSDLDNSQLVSAQASISSRGGDERVTTTAGVISSFDQSAEC